MTQKIITTFIISLAFSSLIAQTNLPMLKPGDRLRNIHIDKIINYNRRSINTVEFDNKLIIFDFWNTGCAGCIEAMPKMEMLQKKFPDEIAIFPVTTQGERDIKAFWKNNRYTKSVNLPSIVEDKILSSLFKNRSIPHEVWIYKGYVIAITGPEYVDEINIKKIIKGETIKWPLKYDFYDYDYKKPLFTINRLGDSTFNNKLNYSIITGYQEGITSGGFSGMPGIYRDINNKTVRSFFFNESIFNAYMYYLNKITTIQNLIKPSYLFSPNQVIWETPNKSIYKYDINSGYQENWLRKHGICIEILNLDFGQTDSTINRNAITQLNSLLGLNVRWEKRKEKVYVLVKTGGNQSRNLKGKKMNLNSLVYAMNNVPTNIYIFNDSGFRDDVLLNTQSFTDLKEIISDLEKNGFSLREEDRVVDKLVFTEVGQGIAIK